MNSTGYGAAVAFCVLLTLLSVAQFIVISILIARLKGIEVENEIKKYALLMRDRIVDRFREFREIRAESRTLAADNSNPNPNQQLPLKHDPHKTSPTTRVPDFPGVNSQHQYLPAQQPPAPYRPSAQQPPAPYHLPVQQPPAPYQPTAPNDNHKRTGSVSTNHQDQLIQSMAQLMKDGLKEVELKKEETAAALVAQQTSKKPHPNKDIVFASYDMMVNETGQILDHCGNKPCDYEEPVQLLGSGGSGLEPAFTNENRNNDVVVASYEVARENTDINDTTDEGYSLVEIPEELPTIRTSSQQLSHKYVNMKVRRGSQH